VAGYDLLGLLVGSEGTLGLITAAWLRLVPAPEAVHVVAGVYPTDAAACAVIERILGSGIEAAAIELLDTTAMRFCGGGFPADTVDGALVLAEADGGALEAAVRRDALLEAMAEGAAAVQQVDDREAVWRWRDGLSSRLAAAHGGKLSEDIVIPLDRLAEMVAAVPRIGERHGLTGLSFGHAGDGNLHFNVLPPPSTEVRADWTEPLYPVLYGVVDGMNGSFSAEHGIGQAKRAELRKYKSEVELAMMRTLKHAFDPMNLMNPGKIL
jgi:FAD/FMN-containing dehydrogenase